jgi:4a-hydroxytetrahydrobiopterin dehydratase
MDQTDALSRLEQLPGWELDGQTIRKTFRWQNFVEAVGFVDRLVPVAEGAQHHPDIDIRWNKVTLSLTTHSAGSLTDKDFALAGQIENMAGT